MDRNKVISAISYPEMNINSYKYSYLVRIL